MLKTKLTQQYSLRHPIISAPMAFAATGSFAAAVCKAGGLGLIGGGYGNADWIAQQFADTEADTVGCGFISWALNDQPELLEATLARNPTAIFLSFADPEPHAAKIKAANIPLFCQVQRYADAQRALDCGVDVIVAQGSEAGGHGEKRATMSLVPEVADLIAKHNSNTLLCAAGGIADGRGLAAALMLGADGVVVGSRLWASHEANVSSDMHAAALAANGDATIRSQVMDVVRALNWPERYTARVLKNQFTERWHDQLDALRGGDESIAKQWTEAWVKGDAENSNTFVGEAAGVIHSIESVEAIMNSMVEQAEVLLNKRWD